MRARNILAPLAMLTTLASACTEPVYESYTVDFPLVSPSVEWLEFG